MLSGLNLALKSYKLYFDDYNQLEYITASNLVQRGYVG